MTAALSEPVPAFNRWLAIAQLLLVGTLWGSTFSLSKIAIQSGVPPLGYAFWQCSGPALSLLLLLRLRGEALPLTRRHLGFYVLCGLCGVTLPNINFYLIIAHVPAGLMAIVITTAPLITFVLALMLGLERFRWLRAAGLVIGFAGALMLLLPRSGMQSGLSGFILLGFLTPFFYALSNVLAARLRPATGGALAFAAGMMTTAGLMQAPLMLSLGQAYAPWPPFAIGDWAIAVQIGVSTLAYVVYFHLLRVAGPVFFSQVGYVVTLTGIVWGVVFFDERLSPWIYGAAAVIFAGLALVNLPRRGKA